MKILGIFVIAVGFLVFVGITAFEARLPLIQFVDKDQVVSKPIRIVIPPETKFVKGTGDDGAKFVDVHSSASNYVPMAMFLGWAKLGGLAICALGGVGLAFERWREKTKQVYGSTTDKNA